MSAGPDRPVRLTFPRCEPYGYSIMADGRQVGKVIEGFAAWMAYLWCEPGPRFTGYADPPVIRPRLGEVKAALRERVEQRGPWWGAVPPDGREKLEMAATRKGVTAHDHDRGTHGRGLAYGPGRGEVP